MKNKKTLFVLGLVSIGGFFGYQYMQKRKAEQAMPITTTSTNQALNQGTHFVDVTDRGKLKNANY